MNLSALLTSAGINTGVCVIIFSLYSILRKQTRFRNVYFGQKLCEAKLKRQDRFRFERFVPSAGWMFKAWEASHDDVYASGGLDGLVFLRVIIFRQYKIQRGFAEKDLWAPHSVDPINEWMQEVNMP